MSFGELLGGGERGAEIERILAERGIVSPVEVQAAAIPPIMSGRNVLASSETGSGKTLAYLAPLLARVDLGVAKPQALVLAPTRELAVQVHGVAASVGEGLGVGVGLVLDGVSPTRQVENLKAAKPRVLVGIATRVLELVEMGKISMHCVKFIVIDECDRLLSAKNIGAVEALVGKTLRDRQVAGFSATVGGREERAFAGLVCGGGFERLKVGGVDKGLKMPDGVSHWLVLAEHRDKIASLRRIVHSRGFDKGLAFFNSGRGAYDAFERLSFHGVLSACLSADGDNMVRKASVEAFESGKARLLVCTDVAARGLDFGGVSHVVNVDWPRSGLDYAHRAGRTGRMGGVGAVVSLVGKNERVAVGAVEKELGISISVKRLEGGEIR